MNMELPSLQRQDALGPTDVSALLRQNDNEIFDPALEATSPCVLRQSWMIVFCGTMMSYVESAKSQMHILAIKPSVN